MSDNIEEKVIDNAWEHSKHYGYDEKCSECYKNVKEFDTDDEITDEEWEQCKKDKLLEEAEQRDLIYED